jgi:hypothetical protein
MMIVTAVCSIIQFLNIFSFTAEGVFGGIMFGCIYGYCFVVLYSLFYKFRAEKEAPVSGYVVQYQLAPTHKV